MSRVLLDTNVIVSAFLFPNSAPAHAVSLTLATQDLMLTQWILDELDEVVERKWPDRLVALHAFLDSIDYELLPIGTSGVLMRDADDQPILDAALAGAVDVIVTGDKDFHALDIDDPQILTPRAFLDSFAT